MLSDLRSYLVTAPAGGFDATRAAALTALQSAVGSRVFPDFLKEGAAMPALVIQLISNHQDYCLDAVPVDVVHPRVQIDVYSNKATERETVGENVKTALSGFTGTMGSTEVGILMLDNEVNSFDSEGLQFRKTLDFKVVHYT